MITSYQQQKRLEQEGAPPEVCQLATIAGVHTDGVTLVFDGEEKARGKHFPCNAALTFQVGQRVRIEKLGGVYVAAYPIKGRARS